MLAHNYYSNTSPNFSIHFVPHDQTIYIDYFMISDSQPKIQLYAYKQQRSKQRHTQTVACTSYRFYLKRHQNAFGGRAPPGPDKRGTRLNRPLRNSTYPLVTRDSVLLQIIYACHYGIFKQESRAVARKPRDATAVLFGLKFADDIHPEVDRLNSFGRRCFAVVGPSTWNSLPDSLRDPALSLNIFRRQLKTHFLQNIEEMY